MTFRFRKKLSNHFRYLIIFGCTILYGAPVSYAQEIDSLWMLAWHAELDNALHNFEIVFETSSEELEQGEIEATWAHLNDYSQWDYIVGDYDGTIWQKWPNRDDMWELKADGNTTTISNRWPNDNSELIINYNNEIKVIWRASSFNDGNSWHIYRSQYGEFEFYTEFEDDPRDWLIYDNTIDELPFDIKMACCFIALYRTIKPFRN